MKVNNSFLKEMVDAGTMQALLEAFGDVCHVGSGIFTPAGERIGKPAHHGPVCSLLYRTEEGRRRCTGCDHDKVEALIAGDKRAREPYPCHAGLVDFCEPIYCEIADEKVLVGIFFAGQVLCENFVPTGETVRRLRLLARDTGVDADELLARLMQVPRVSPEDIQHVRSWMEHFSNLIGILLEKKAAAQNLLLDVINAADDQIKVVQTIQRHLRPAAVSIFLRNEQGAAQDTDRIFLAATTCDSLMARLPLALETEPETVSYRQGEGLTGWTYKTGQVLHLSDAQDASAYPSLPSRPDWSHKVKEIPDAQETKAFLGVPIRSSSGETVGVIRAVRLRDNPDFDPNEIELLTGIAALLSSTFFTANLSRRHQQKINALTQAETLLETLTEPNASLEGTATRMATALATQYFGRNGWQAVYVLQHMKSSRQFRFIAFEPHDIPEDCTGAPFSDEEGVAGWVLRERKPFAASDCKEVGVLPTTPWKSVICVPIYRGGEMWGAVSLCGNHVSQSAIAEALPQIHAFADNISIVCELSEVFDAKRTAAAIASNIMSLNLEAHEVYKSLEAAHISALHLCALIDGEAREVAEAIVHEVDEGLSWADVCVELGRYIRYCQADPSTSLDLYREQHSPVRAVPGAETGKCVAWEHFDLASITNRALDTVVRLAEHSKVTLRRDVGEVPCIMFGDSNLVYRAVRNLLENAVVHAPVATGSIRKHRNNVSVACTLKSMADRPRARLVVSDSGVGMNAGTLTATREIYSDPKRMTRTSLAPGFGTMIVAFAVAVHNGTASIEGTPGGGTTIVVEFPLENKLEEKQ